ncbi:MAG: hypothetical protein IKL68_00925 [Clostridia bacterium]|nr:hypothetical protein [Clostridia bacterium]
MLVAENKLEVDVFDEVIKKETLVNIINKYCETPIEYTNSNIKYGFVKQYLGVYTGEYERRVFEEDVVGAGKLKLMIAKGSDLNGKWVAMFRTKGMKIFDNNIRTAQQNYSALFFPGDDEVDRFLRKIENPTHDFFDPEIRIANAYEKEQAIQRYKKIKQWIKKKIEEYTEIIVNENDYLEGMEEYIQLDDNETEESAAAIPEVEIVNYETKLKKTMPQIQDKSKGGIEFTTKFTPDDGVSKTKHKFEGEGTDEPGTDKKGLVKDYHNSFKFKPRTVINDNKIKLAFALDEYDNITTNIEILSVGEDDSVTEEIPRIVEAIDLVTGEDLEIKNNAVVNIPVASTNLIEIQFERKFESRYKINVYQVRGDEDED